MSGLHLEYQVSVLGPAPECMLPAERDWTLCYLPSHPGMTRDAMAEDAARVWWEDTDQCTECEVVLLFVGGLTGTPPARFVRKVALEIRTVGSVRHMGKPEADRYQAEVARRLEASATGQQSTAGTAVAPESGA